MFCTVHILAFSRMVVRMEMGFHVTETTQSVTENTEHVPGMYVIWSSKLTKVN